MMLSMEAYRSQLARWPSTGRHILANHDDESIVVYQAYSAQIGQYAATHHRLGGPGFSLDRMSWIKTNFLWMMHRSGWGTKTSQEVVLAIRISREGFDRILSLAVPSSFHPDLFETHEQWQHALASSEVRLQWDPDHDPDGTKCQRRAIQLGLRGSVFRQFVEDWKLDMEDLRGLVGVQRELRGDLQRLVIPREDVYPVTDAATAARIRLSPPTPTPSA